MDKKQWISGFGVLVLTVLVILHPGLPLSTASAAKFPTKAITLIVPWAPGGTSDITCRILAPGMSKYLGKPVVVKNVPGGGSMVGARALVQSKPDGHTLAWLGVSAALAQYTTLSPVMMDEYVAVARTVDQPLLLLVSVDSPWKSMAAFLKYAKENPGKLKNGNAGTGIIDHVFSAAFMEATGTRFIQVPYKGWGPAVAALAGGHVDTVFAPMSTAKPLLKAGKIRALGIAADERRPTYPEVPTFKELGVEIQATGYWETIVVPKGSPPSVVQALEDAISKSIRDPEVDEKLKNAEIEMSFLGSKAVVPFRKAQDLFLRKHTEELGLRIRK